MEFFTWLDPIYLVKTGGLLLILLIIFIECGFFLGFIFPGDSLLFAAGLLSGSQFLNAGYWELIILINLAAISGYALGYAIGIGPTRRLLPATSTWYYKTEYLKNAQLVIHEYGMPAFILARFVPLVRTFAPIVAGITKVDFKLFMIYNVLGSVIWIGIFVSLGYFLGKFNPLILYEIKWVMMVVIIATMAPIVYGYFRKRRQDIKERENS